MTIKILKFLIFKASIEKQLFALNKLGDAKLPGLKIRKFDY